MTNKTAPQAVAGTPATNGSARRLIPATQWPQIHVWPSLPGLRHLIFNAKTNGFDAVVRRGGRRVLIDEQAFFQWIEQQGKA